MTVKTNNSKLYSFLDQEHEFTVHLFRGEKVLDEVINLHNLGENSKKFFRDVILSFQTMIAFLKPGEGFGIYVDSEDPYFRFKIETNWTGNMRTLLLPEGFDEFPEKFTGECRVSKLFSNNQKPYTSILRIENLSFSELANKILNESYQMQASTFIGDNDNHCVLILKLPQVNVDKNLNQERLSINEYWLKRKSFFSNIFNQPEMNEEDLIENFRNGKFEYLKSVDVSFKCNCSEERFLENLNGMAKESIEEIFSTDKSIEVKCDYCKKKYQISKDQLN